MVTVPEHRLSLENKAIELAWKGEEEASRELHQVLEDQKNARDILDESDVILHAKYQLVYTLGNCAEVDAGRLRWQAAACVLASVSKHANVLADIFQSCSLVFTPGGVAYQFPERLRLTSKAKDVVTAQHTSCYQHLCKLIVDDFLAGAHHICVQLRSHDRDAFERCVLLAELDDEPWLQLPEEAQPLAYLLRGLLSNEVLLLALTKRYRVEYGARPESACRFAVPYRAKDVAAERAEFGHADVAILLTYLTYYRGGLDEASVKEVLDKLAQKTVDQAASIYEGWTSEMGDDMPSELRLWSGINLDDPKIVRQTIAKIRKHVRVVDFWLDQIVFPMEAKCFERKLVSTAWDLSRAEHVTTGFSGTDDARLLLPLTIAQKNLPQLDHTNGLVLRNLLQQAGTFMAGLRGFIFFRWSWVKPVVSRCRLARGQTFRVASSVFWRSFQVIPSKNVQQYHCWMHLDLPFSGIVTMCTCKQVLLPSPFLREYALPGKRFLPCPSHWHRSQWCRSSCRDWQGQQSVQQK